MPAYEVVGDWAELSAVTDAASCWVHNAIVATGGGEIIGDPGRTNGALLSMRLRRGRRAVRRNG
jgi:hypothetical protein